MRKKVPKIPHAAIVRAPGLLPAEIVPIGQHPLHEIAVSHLRALQLNTSLLHRQFQPKVAHDRSHHGLTGELSLRVQIESERGHYMVTIHDLSLFAYKDGSIRIAVQRHADMRPMPTNRFL